MVEIRPVQLWERVSDGLQAGVLRVEGDTVVMQTWNAGKGWWGNEFLWVGQIDLILDWVVLAPMRVEVIRGR